MLSQPTEVDLSTDTRSTGRHHLADKLTDSRQTLSQYSVDTWSTLDRRSDQYVDRQSTEMSVDTSIDTPQKIHDPLKICIW